jgi:hypothetical protein
VKGACDKQTKENGRKWDFHSHRATVASR